MHEKNYELLSWDTETFGYNVARITLHNPSVESLQELLNSMKQDGVKLAYWNFSDDDLNEKLAAHYGGIQVDEKLLYQKILGDDIYTRSPEIIDYLYHDQTDALISLALQSGVYSRYKIDTHFTHHEYEKLYNA